MRFRKLRIAWSVFWGIACLLLIGLWVRSYWIAHGLLYTRSTTIVSIFTSAGIAGVNYTSFPDGTRIPTEPGFEWHSNAPVPDPNMKPFMWVRGQYGLLIRVPVWCCESILILVAALPWLRWSDRYSLRTLLIATTLVAVVLGLAVWASKK